ncbi:MAG: GH3 auxin-responsive promoter family protein [Candidatus Competibacteraceae bacterium]
MTGNNGYRNGIKGALNHLLSRNVEWILSIPGSRLYKQFIQATRQVERTQAALLADILQYGGDTVYGREHRFNTIRNYRDYREHVPVNDYEALRPYVNRHIQGETDVLFPGKPLMYNRSSGTTALPKLIPVTPYDFERTIKNRGKLWLYGLMRQFPGIFRGKDLTVVSPAVDGYTPDGTPFGSLSGLVYQNIPEFMKRVHTIPYSVVTIPDYETRTYISLRSAIACDVTMLLTVNPGTILNLVTRADQWKTDLIRDIHDGSVRNDLNIEPEIRAQIEMMFKPDHRRAAQLEKLAQQRGVLRPADYWPNLRLIHTWKNGNCALMLPKLKPWFHPDTPILDFGYLASEIMATDLVDPATDGSILQVRSGFYEFTRFEEGDNPERRFLLAHELDVGAQYYLYVTTFSGLYRYDMNDVVEVVGKFNETPILKFLFKGKGITSIQGEKLSEKQCIQAVHQAALATGLRHEFFVGYADAEQQRYLLYIEFSEDYTESLRTRFTDAVDRALMDINIEYEAKRKSDRLRPLTVVAVGKNFFERYKLLRLAEGAHEGQFKWQNLTALQRVKQQLDQLAIDHPPCYGIASAHIDRYEAVN